MLFLRVGKIRGSAAAMEFIYNIIMTLIVHLLENVNSISERDSSLSLFFLQSSPFLLFFSYFLLKLADLGLIFHLLIITTNHQRAR